MTVRHLTIEEVWANLDFKLDEEGCRWLNELHGFFLAQARELEQERRVNAELRRVNAELRLDLATAWDLYEQSMKIAMALQEELRT